MNLSAQFRRYVAGSVFGMLGLSCYILADTFFIARGLGEVGLTALNLAIPVFSLLSGVGLMIGVGGATLYSLRRQSSVFTHAAVLSAMASLLFLACVAFAVPIARLLGADDTTLADTAVYIRTLCLFSPCFLASNLLSAFVRNDGGPRRAMAAQLTGSFANILLDYLFIFPLGWGMFGAVIATCMAPILSILVLAGHFRAHRSTFSLAKTALSRQTIVRILTLGLPSLITEFASAVVLIVFNVTILSLAGNTGVAAYGIIANIALVVTSIYTGIAQGVQPLVSEACRRDDAAARRALCIRSVVLAVLISIGVYAVAFVCAEPIVAVFNRDASPTLAAIAARGMRLYFTAYFAAGINAVTASALAAADRPQAAFVVSILRAVVLPLFFTPILAAWWALDGVWLAVPATEAVTLVVAMMPMGQLLRKKQ